MRRLELLAPAGSENALTAAVQSGADAVYLGTDMFSARQSAGNFPINDLKRWVDYCHLYGVKVHAAVNTLIKEKELSNVEEYAKKLSDAGVDAVIIQDMGAVEIFQKCAPELPLHGSTQMTVTSVDGVRFLEQLGFERVVLARELSKKEIAHICKHANAEIEVFVHGALCMCYSGQCLMSSVIGGRSGNRGRCAQPCRLPYEIKGTQKYYLSPKDLCLIDELRELDEMGVTSLKIEGRLKRPEYVSAVVGIYRKYLDSFERVSNKDRDQLKNAFNRGGFTKGFFAGDHDMMSYDNPANAADNIFTDEAKKRAAENANIRKIPVKIKGTLKNGQVFRMEFSDGDGHHAEASGTKAAEPALKRPIDKKRLEEQIAKLGNTPFLAECIDLELDEGITIPISQINEVRREAAEKLVRMRCERPHRKTYDFMKRAIKRPDTEICELSADVETVEQAEAAIAHGIKTVYVPWKIFDRVNRTAGVDVIAKLPYVDNFYPDIEAEKLMVSSNGQIYRFGDRTLYGGFRLNIYNLRSCEFYGMLKRITISPELNFHEIREAVENSNAYAEAIAYGRIPLMICRNCPLKAAGECQKNTKPVYIKDRKNQEFPILCGDGCTSQILNSKPVFIADRIDEIKKSGINCLKLMFTVENSQECDTIINIYQKALKGEKAENPFRENDFTRGHWFRGVK